MQEENEHFESEGIPSFWVRAFMMEFNKSIEDLDRPQELRTYWRELNKTVIIEGQQMRKNLFFCYCGCRGPLFVPVGGQYYNVPIPLSCDDDDATPPEPENYNDMPPLETV